MFDDGLSNAKIDAAGKVLRTGIAGLVAGPEELTPHEAQLRVADAQDVVAMFRQRWTRPPSTTGELASEISSRVHPLVGGALTVGSRIKRLGSIEEKLPRLRTLRLSTLADIGGIRVVVDDTAAQRIVVERLARLWTDDVRKVLDYVQKPKDTGYRAVHLIVRRRGLLHEVQVRTSRQHQWAMEMEAVAVDSKSLGLKSGLGDPEIVEAFRQRAAQLAAEE